jgi:O-antigen ligase
MMAETNVAPAHNSYVHAFAELGLFGGTLFLGMSYVCVVGLWRLRRCQGVSSIDVAYVGLDRWRSCLLAILVAYGVGIFALSRAYAIPTYLVLGAVAAYARTAQESGGYDALPVVSGPLARRLVCVSLGFLVFMHVLVKVV